MREAFVQGAMGLGLGMGVAAGVTLTSLYGIKKCFPGANLLEAPELAIRDVERGGAQEDVVQSQPTLATSSSDSD